MSGGFRGLTWDHPRGYNALAAAANAQPVVCWDKQPLEGFESASIAELASRYDLIVLDHPHIGEAVAEDCLRPIEEVFAADEIAAWCDQTVGPAMASYHWTDRHWALPLDVATQVAAYRADMLGEAPPSDWQSVLRLSERRPVALSLAGPHAILSLFSLSVSLGAIPGGEDLIPDAVACEAFSILRELARRAPSGSAELNPIGLLGEMASADRIAYIPLIYGYVNYSRPGLGRVVSFTDAPVAPPHSRRGSVLGGTGIAITRRADPDWAMLDHLRWLMSPEAQTEFIPDHDGQPSARIAWLSTEVNARAGGFYSATLGTVEDSWVRPRFDGYIRFQADVSALVRDALFDGDRVAVGILENLRRVWRESRANARGPLE